MNTQPVMQNFHEVCEEHLSKWLRIKQTRQIVDWIDSPGLSAGIVIVFICMLPAAIRFFDLLFLGEDAGLTQIEAGLVTVAIVFAGLKVFLYDFMNKKRLNELNRLFMLRVLYQAKNEDLKVIFEYLSSIKPEHRDPRPLVLAFEPLYELHRTLDKKFNFEEWCEKERRNLNSQYAWDENN